MGKPVTLLRLGMGGGGYHCDGMLVPVLRCWVCLVSGIGYNRCTVTEAKHIGPQPSSLIVSRMLVIEEVRKAVLARNYHNMIRLGVKDHIRSANPMLYTVQYSTVSTE